MPSKTKTTKEAVDTLVISDLHLGDPATRTDEISDLLARYKFKRLILNGDIINGLNLKRLHTGHWQVLSRLRELSGECEVVWVHGNHDPDMNVLSKLLGMNVYNSYSWQEKGHKYLAIHGHQFDRFMHDNLILSLVAFAFYYVLKRFDSSDYFVSLFKSKNSAWKRNVRQVAKGAANYARLVGADTVFCGHVHMIDSREMNGVQYYNSGTWVEKPSGCYIINAGGVKFRQID